MVQVNQGEKEQRYGLKVTVFVILAVALSSFIVAGALLDMHIGTNFIELLFKCIIIAGILAYAGYKKECHSLWEGKFFTPFLFLAIIPCVIFSLSVIGSPDSSPSFSLIVFTVLGVLTTAIWEELFFRYVGKSLFGKGEGFAFSDFMMLTTVFAAVHLINMFFYPPLDVLLQVAEAATVGVFLLALYCKTKNIMVPITSHFVLNLVAGLFPIFVTHSSNRLFAGLENLFVVAVRFYCLLSGI